MVWPARKSVTTYFPIPLMLLPFAPIASICFERIRFVLPFCLRSEHAFKTLSARFEHVMTRLVTPCHALLGAARRCYALLTSDTQETMGFTPLTDSPHTLKPV